MIWEGLSLKGSAGPSSVAPNSKAVDGFFGRILRPAGLSGFSVIGSLVTPFQEIIAPVLGLFSPLPHHF
jgi:hypothetical protein